MSDVEFNVEEDIQCSVVQDDVNDGIFYYFGHKFWFYGQKLQLWNKHLNKTHE